MAPTGQTMTQPAQMGLGRSILLHLFPGALLTAVYLLIGPTVLAAGYPPAAAIFFSIPVLIVVELGYLLYLGRRENGRTSLQGVVVYRESIPWWNYAVFVPGLVLYGGLVFVLLGGIESYLASTLFSWMPAWTLPAAASAMADAPRSALLTTLVVGLALNGVAGPLVEELYFRGFLLPRISRFGTVGSTLLNVVLFSIYHFFTPWGNLTRIIATIPLVYLVARKRNIYLSIWTHCLLNTIGMLLIAASILGAPAG